MSSSWFGLRQSVKTQINALTGYETVVANVPTLERADLTAPRILVVPADAAIEFRNRSSTPKTLALFIAFFAPLDTEPDKWDDLADDYLAEMEEIIETLMENPPAGYRAVEVDWATPISEDRWRNVSQFASIARASYEQL